MSNRGRECPSVICAAQIGKIEKTRDVLALEQKVQKSDMVSMVNHQAEKHKVMS